MGKGERFLSADKLSSVLLRDPRYLFILLKEGSLWQIKDLDGTMAGHSAATWLPKTQFLGLCANPCKPINFGSFVFGTETARVKMNTAFCTQHLCTRTLPKCVSNSSPRQHPSSNKWSFLLILPQHPASFSRTWLLFALQGTKILVHALCFSSTGNVLHIACQVIKLKIWVGPSPTELTLEFFYPES